MDNNFMNPPMIPGGYQQPTQSPIPNTVPMAPPATAENSSPLGFKFNITKDNEEPRYFNVNTGVVEPPAKRRGRPRKEDKPASLQETDIVKAEGIVEDAKTIWTYGETTKLLHETLDQVDMVASELKQEMDAVRTSRTNSRKYSIYTNLAETMGTILNTRLGVIKEINSSITRSNDLDYKKAKDKREMDAAAASDDRFIMDFYANMMNNPKMAGAIQGPSLINATVASAGGDGVIRTPIASVANNKDLVDAGYLNYLSRLTPEQNTMYYEDNPNVKTVVVYDKATNNKFFQVMDLSTMQVVPNVTVLDNRFMENTYIDMKNMTAKNNDLGEVFPVITINDDVTSQY